MVPVYLNQRLVFDILAMLVGGISTVSTVTETASSAQAQDSSIRGAFGLAEAIAALLNIGFSGGLSRKALDEAATSETSTRVHTPASLFFMLHGILEARRLLRYEREDGYEPEVGDFIDFTASLVPNPLTATFERFAQMGEIAQVFARHAKDRERDKDAVKQAQALAQQVKAMVEKLQASDSVDLVAGGLASGRTAVVTLEQSFLNDPGMADLIDGTFHVCGKVIRVIKSSDESISLVRRTAFAAVPPELLSTAFEKLTETMTASGIPIPYVKVSIKGPAIQVIPICIYA